MYGLAIMAIIAIMGGAIAYIGDKLGTKVGKRRMSLFGLRPKHTSIIVTIITGMLISAVTLGILSVMSENVRTALFGMEKLKAEMQSLNDSVAAGQKALADKTRELNLVSKDIESTKAELIKSQEARDAISSELIDVQAAYEESERKLEKSSSDVASLEATKAKMEAHISNLQVATKALEEGLTHVREGQVIFRVGEVLSGAVVRPGLSEEESEHVINGIVHDTNALVLKKLNITGEKSVLYLTRANLLEVAKQISRSEEPLAVRITAAVNIISGEPALAEIHVYPYKLIYSKGDSVWSSVISGGDNAQQDVLKFLSDVNKAAREQGVLPDPLSGDVGTLPGEELYRTIDSVERRSGALKIIAKARTDTYSDGPVQIELIIQPIN